MSQPVAPRTAVPDPAPQRLGAGFVSTFVLAYFGLWVSLLAPIIITLQLRVRELAPGREAGVLSLVLAIGAVLGLLVNPIAGRLSDRTTSRFGMRRPWLLLGSLVAFAGALVMALAPGVAGLLIGWALAQVGFNTTLAVLTAVLPDHVGPQRRGLVSGLLGLAQGLAAAVGAGVAGGLAGQNLTAGILVPAAVGLVCGIAVVVVLRDRRLTPADRPPLTAADLARAFTFSPRRHPDFGWAWLSRFAIFMATAAVLNYQLLYLVSQIGLDDATAAATVAIGTGVQTATVVLTSGLSGWLSDRLRRRRVFVIAAALACGAGLVVMSTATALPAYFVAMVLIGVGQGIYFSVDLALVADVLPDPDGDAAKDLGVINVANLLPQSLAPALAPLLLMIGGSGADNYPALFLTGAVFAVLSAAAIVPIRGVR